MTANAEFILGAGPYQDDDVDVYEETASADGFDIQTVASKKYFHVSGSLNAPFRPVKASIVSVTKTFGWPIIVIQIQGAFPGTGNRYMVAQFGGFMDLHVICTTDTTHYKFRLYKGTTQIGSDSSEYAVGASDRVLRATLDGVKWRLDIDGTEEISAAETSKLSSVALNLRYQGQGGATAATNDIYWRTPSLWQSNSSADRPGTAVTGEGRKPNGDMVSEYADEICGEFNNDGTYTKWDEIPGAAVNDADFNCGHSINNEREISDFENTTLGALSGANCWARGKTNGDPKTTISYLQERDGSDNIQEVANAALVDETWRRMAVGFATDPNGDPWTPTRFNAAGFGIRTVDTNDGHDEWSILYVEVFDVDDDPPERPWPQRKPAGVGYTPVRQASL